MFKLIEPEEKECSLSEELLGIDSMGSDMTALYAEELSNKAKKLEQEIERLTQESLERLELYVDGLQHRYDMADQIEVLRKRING